MLISVSLAQLREHLFVVLDEAFVVVEVFLCVLVERKEWRVVLQVLIVLDVAEEIHEVLELGLDEVKLFGIKEVDIAVQRLVRFELVRGSLFKRLFGHFIDAVLKYGASDVRLV